MKFIKISTLRSFVDLNAAICRGASCSLTLARRDAHSDSLPLSLLLSPDLGQVVCAFLRCASAQRLFTPSHVTHTQRLPKHPLIVHCCHRPQAAGWRQQAGAYQSDRWLQQGRDIEISLSMTAPRKLCKCATLPCAYCTKHCLSVSSVAPLIAHPPRTVVTHSRYPAMCQSYWQSIANVTANCLLISSADWCKQCTHSHPMFSPHTHRTTNDN